MSRTIQDLRHALRVTWRSPLVSLLAVGAFALGIAVTTTVFSIFHGVLLKPLPYPSPDQLVIVFDTQPACSTCPASFPKFHDWKSRNQVFAAIGGSTPAGFVLSGHGDPLQLDAVRTTARGSGNLMPPIIAAAHAYATEQEICDVLREVFGTYTDPAEF